MSADLRYALRALLKTPGFTLVAVLTLALGIGANTAIFSLVKSALLNPVPFPRARELMFLRESTANFPQAAISWPDLVDWQRDNHTFESIAGLRDQYHTLTGLGDPTMIEVKEANAALLDVLRVRPLLGRGFSAAEDKAGAPGLALVSYEFWQQRFGGNTRALGQTLTLDGSPYLVIGVLPPGINVGFLGGDVWTQLGRHADEPGFQARGNHPGIIAIGRLQPGTTARQALADLKRVSGQIKQAHPGEAAGLMDAAGKPLIDFLVDDYRRGLWMLSGAVGLVLLIVCVNLANLLLARGIARESEWAVRGALGATRSQLLRQLLLEVLILALAGGALGLLIAAACRGAMLQLGGVAAIVMQRTHIDGSALAATVLLSLLTAVAFGVWPACRAARSDVRVALQAGGRGGSAGHGVSRAQAALTIAEVALTVMLLVAAGLLIKSLTRAQAADLGFRSRNVLIAGVALLEQSYPNAEKLDSFIDRLLARVKTLSGVESVSLAWSTPMNNNWESNYKIDGRPPPAGGMDPFVEMNGVSDDYFRSLGIQLLRGRTFGPQDNRSAQPVAIVDQAFVNREWPNEGPIGKHVRLNGQDATVIGVAPTLRLYGYAVRPGIVQAYLPLRQDQVFFRSYMLIVHAERSAPALERAVKRAVFEVDPNQPLWNIRTLDERIGDTFNIVRLNSLLMTVFAGVALLLAAIGLYGVLAFQVSRRAREFGVRMALGALQRQVLLLVLGRGLRFLAIGLVLGMVGAWVLGRLLQSLLYETDAFDLPIAGAVTLLLGGVALLACWLPARRATRVDPLVALRAE